MISRTDLCSLTKPHFTYVAESIGIILDVKDKVFVPPFPQDLAAVKAADKGRGRLN
jgi:hypothetical protein